MLRDVAPEHALAGVGRIALTAVLDEPAEDAPAAPTQEGAAPPTGPRGHHGRSQALDAPAWLAPPPAAAGSAGPQAPLASREPAGPSAAFRAAAGDAPLWFWDPDGFLVGSALYLFVLLLVPPLYHRLHRDRLLDQWTRARLHEVIAGRPGTHIEQLARAAGCSRSTAAYHLRFLARCGEVVALGTGKSKHFYPRNGHRDTADGGRRALLSSPKVRRVALAVADRPGTGRRALAASMGLSPSTRSWHVARLRGLDSSRTARRLRPRACSPRPSSASSCRAGPRAARTATRRRRRSSRRGAARCRSPPDPRRASVEEHLAAPTAPSGRTPRGGPARGAGAS